MQFILVLPLTSLSFPLLNKWKHENTQGNHPPRPLGCCDAHRFVYTCIASLDVALRFQIDKWSNFDCTNLPRSVDRLKELLMLGRQKETKVFCTVRIAKETILLVSNVGISVFPLCDCWKTDSRTETLPVWVHRHSASLSFAISIPKSFCHPSEVRWACRFYF